jgi:hypothetical protein
MRALEHICFMFLLDFFRDSFGNPIQIQKKPERNTGERIKNNGGKTDLYILYQLTK